MERRKGNVIILLLGGLALIFAAGMGYFYLQTQQSKQGPVPSVQLQPPKQPARLADTQDNWKTYTSKLNNFTFKYPSTWKIKEAEDGTSINCNRGNILDDVCFIEILKKRTTADIIEGTQRILEVTEPEYKLTVSDATVAGYPAKVFDYPYPIGKMGRVTLVEVKEDIYRFSQFKDDKEFDKLILTFRFNN